MKLATHKGKTVFILDTLNGDYLVEYQNGDISTVPKSELKDFSKPTTHVWELVKPGSSNISKCYNCGLLRVVTDPRTDKKVTRYQFGDDRIPRAGTCSDFYALQEEKLFEDIRKLLLPFRVSVHQSQKINDLYEIVSEGA